MELYLVVTALVSLLGDHCTPELTYFTAENRDQAEELTFLWLCVWGDVLWCRGICSWQG